MRPNVYFAVIVAILISGCSRTIERPTYLVDLKVGLDRQVAETSLSTPVFKSKNESYTSAVYAYSRGRHVAIKYTERGPKQCDIRFPLCWIFIPVQIVGAISDVAELNKARAKALEDTKSYLIIVYDQDEKIIYAEQAANETLEMAIDSDTFKSYVDSRGKKAYSIINRYKLKFKIEERICALKEIEKPKLITDLVFIYKNSIIDQHPDPLRLLSIMLYCSDKEMLSYLLSDEIKEMILLLSDPYKSGRNYIYSLMEQADNEINNQAIFRAVIWCIGANLLDARSTVELYRFLDRKNSKYYNTPYAYMWRILHLDLLDGFEYLKKRAKEDPRYKESLILSKNWKPDFKTCDDNVFNPLAEGR
jgi:hypothetical protein